MDDRRRYFNVDLNGGAGVMCGIAGAVNWGDLTSLKRMITIQAHRGPDDEGTWDYTAADGTWIGLGSRRLAILDLSPAGHMPMQTPDGSLTIVYNGEIYNYPHLRHTLEAKGYQFRTSSDTEAILYMYQEYGPDCVRQFNGIFALALWDQQRQQLFLARDHFGIKPLYYLHDSSTNRLLFASEIKALLELPDVHRQMNLSALHQYLTFLWTPDPLTMFENIYKLPAGHYAIFKQGKLQIEQYWDLRFPDADHRFTADETTLAEELRRRFSDTVKTQMLSDVPLGAFLSAGLDSSSIVAAMARNNPSPVRTFTIAFPDQHRVGEVTLDDTAVARRTAQHFGCQHTEIIVEPDVASLLPELVWHMDEPTADPAIITAYLVNREARRNVTVLLSGVGGDELFAGYRKYRAHFLAQQYQRVPAFIRRYAIEPTVSALPPFSGTALKGYVRLTKKMVRSGSLPPRQRFLMDSVYLTDEQKRTLYTEQTRSQIGNANPFYKHQEYFENVDNADFLNQMLYLDTKAFMVSLNLNYNDKMSMASSVEVRVPFLDWELAEWTAQNIPPQLKMKGSTTKHILREAMRPLLPAEVLQQKKAGFGAPIDRWLKHELCEMTRDLLNPNIIKQRGLFEPTAIQQLLEDQEQGRSDNSLQLWQFLTLELWQQRFLDAVPQRQ